MSATSEQLDWLFSSDTGLSSKCIWRRMVDNGCGVDAKNHPHDPDDLGRCIRLLDRFPEWRKRLREMRAVGPVWAALVEQWDELEGLYREEAPNHRGTAPRCYARMREVIDPVRAANPSRPSTITIEFGKPGREQEESNNPNREWWDREYGQPSPLQAENVRLCAVVDAARKLVNALDKCQPAIDGAFVFGSIHGMRYEGPGYWRERESLRAALDAPPLAREEP